MTNYEKLFHELKHDSNYLPTPTSTLCETLIRPMVLEPLNLKCTQIQCALCAHLVDYWGHQESECLNRPIPDNLISIDNLPEPNELIKVWNYDYDAAVYRHFCKYNQNTNEVYIFHAGQDIYTIDSSKDIDNLTVCYSHGERITQIETLNLFTKRQNKFCTSPIKGSSNG